VFVHRLKFTPPPVLSTWLERPHLERRFKPGIRVVSITAGPGYGKTVLATRLFEAWTGPKLWYSLDHSDTDLAVFAAHLDAGLRSLGLDMPAFDAVDAASLGSPKDVGGRFADALAPKRASDDAVTAPLIVFDDAHTIEGSRTLTAVNELVDRGYRHGACFIVTGRSIPIPLHQIAASSQLVTFGATDLAFDEREARAFIEHAKPGDAGSASEWLVSRAEGWPAGLALIASGGPRHEAGDRNAPPAAGDDEARRILFDYLASEVLNGLSEAERRFLEDTSIVDRLEIGLCDAIRNEGDSRTTLESFARRGLFVVRIADDTFTYHQLFQEFLRHHARRAQQAGRASLLHRRAGDFMAARGEPAVAIEHYLEAGDAVRAAALLEEKAFSLLRAGLVSAVGAIVRKIPEARIASSPTLLAALGRLQRERGEWDAALSSLERSMAAARERKEYDVLAESVRICAPILASRGEFERLRTMLAEALAVGLDLPETSVTSLRMTLAAVNLETERLDEALEMYKEITPSVVSRGDLGAHGLVLHNTAVAHLRRGDIYAGLSTYERALKLKEAAGQRVSKLTTLGDIVYAKTLLGDIDEAERAADELLAQAQDVGASAMIARAHEQRGVLRLMRADVAGAEAAFDAAQAACDPGDVLVLPDIEHGLAQCALASGDVDRADVLSARAIGVFKGAGRRQQIAPMLLTRAACAVARGDWDSAAAAAREAVAASGDGLNALLHATACIDAAVVLARCTKQAKGAASIELDKAASQAATEAIALIHQRDYRFLLRTKASAFETLRLDMRRWQIGSGLLPFIREGKPAASLRIEMLGPLRVSVAGANVPQEAWKRRRAPEIFAYLVSNRGQGVTRERLVDLYWPDSDADAAHDSLRVTITAIRKAVGEIIKYEANAYCFVAPAGTTVDVDDFDACIERAQQAAAAGDTDEARSNYLAGASLYRGDFLEGMQEGGWQWRERERLRATCLEALRWLAVERTEAGDTRGRRLAYERLLEVAPFDLEAVKARLDALCEESRVAEARRDYADWRARYLSAVGAEAPEIWPSSYDAAQSPEATRTETYMKP
jgi:DNA-binding SARP family transcriptional activator